MAAFAVSIAPRALAEVAAIVQWWQANRLGAPRLFQQELDAALLAIAEYPEIGHRLPLHRYPNARSYVLCCNEAARSCSTMSTRDPRSSAWRACGTGSAGR